MTSFICGLTRLADSDSIDDRGVPRLLFMGNACQFAFNSHGCAVVKLLARLRYKLLIFLATRKLKTTILHESKEGSGAEAAARFKFGRSSRLIWLRGGEHPSRDALREISRSWKRPTYCSG